MRSDAFKRDVDVSHTMETSSFTIQGNAKMFSILADKLYSDKPRAVIREVSCNALDAHGMNGQTRPFRIALPNAMEPMLTIRDFGPGMTHDQIMHNYTSFGSSTKDQDDDAVGGFGLGCKSPFSYADAFTVTAFELGRKRNYAAYRGPDGIPQMTFVGAEPSDEEPGIEVRVPVKERDFYTFQTTALDLLQHFPEGSFELFGAEVELVEYQSKEAEYYVRINRPSRAHILMGPIAYPLDWSLVLDEDEARLPETITMVFEIGSLDLLPSREGLSYDKQTIQRLHDRYKLICDKYAETQYELIKPLNRFEQLKFIQSLKNNGTWSMIENRWPATYSEPGPDDKVKIKVQLTPAGFPGIDDFISLRGRPQMVSVSAKSSRRTSTALELSNRRMGDEKELSTKFTIKNLSPLTVFVFDDMTDVKVSKRREAARFKQLAADWGTREIDVVFFDDSQVVTPGHTDPDNKKWIDATHTITGDWQSADELRSALAEWEHVDTNVFALSELDLPVSTKTAAIRTSAKTELRVLSTSKYDYSRKDYYGQRGNGWTDRGETYTSGVYIPLSNYDLDDFDEKWLSHEFLESDFRILGLSKKARAQIKRDGTEADFERLDKYLERITKEALADEAVRQELARQAFVAGIKTDPVVKSVMSLTNASKGLFPKIDQAMEALADPQDTALATKVNAVRAYCSNRSIALPKIKMKSPVAREARRAYDSSPLLRLAIQAYDRDRSFILRDNDDVRALLKVRKPTTASSTN